jgi:hypothetical protein
MTPEDTLPLPPKLRAIKPPSVNRHTIIKDWNWIGINSSLPEDITGIEKDRIKSPGVGRPTPGGLNQ